MLQVTAIEIFHRDVRVVIANTEIVNMHNVRMIDLRDQLVLLQESVKRTGAVGNIRNLLQHFEYHFHPGRLSFRKIDA